MAINKTFVEHSILKASDLNELVTQANGYVHETDVKKPDKVDILQYHTEGAELPLAAHYTYGGLPTVTFYGHCNETEQDYIAICTYHCDTFYSIHLYVKNDQNKYVYNSDFHDDNAETTLERSVSDMISGTPVSLTRNGVMTKEDKAILDELANEVDGIAGSHKEYDSDILVSGYYNLNGVSVGDAFAGVMSSSSSQYCKAFEIRIGSSIELHTKTVSGNAGYVRPYCVVSKSTGKVVAIAPTTATQDLTEDPYEYTANEDVILYVTCTGDYLNDFSLIVDIDSQFVNKSDFQAAINSVNGDIDALEQELAGMSGSSQTFTSSIFSAHEGKYYNMNGLSVGSNAPSETLSSSSSKACTKIEIPSGTNITLYTYVTSGNAGYVRPYCIVSKATGKVIAIAGAATTFDYTETPFEYTAQETIVLYLDIDKDHYSSFSLVAEIPSEFVTQEDLGDIQQEIEDLTEDVQDIKGFETSSASGLLGSASLGYYNFNGKSVGDTAPQTMTNNPNTYRYSKILQVKANSIISLTTSVTTGTAGYVLCYALTDSVYKILKLAPTASGQTNVNVELNIEEDGYLYVCCNQDLASTFHYRMQSPFAGDILNQSKEYTDSKADNTYYAYLSRKVVVPHSPKILVSGASFTAPENTWAEKMGTLLGATVTNKAVAGTNIRDLALKLKAGTISVSGMDAILIQHVHNYDVFTLPDEYVNKTVAQYEASGEMDSWVGTGTITDDYGYAIGYDYVIKKLRALIFAQKSQDSYDQSTAASRNYMQGNYPQQTKIVLATHWHDARVTLNSSIRKLCKKWGLPLLNFDEQIGFSKDVLNEAGVQPSIEYVGLNSGDYAPYETIEGVVYGFHPSLGNNDIQWRFAVIAADKFLVLPS